MPASSSVRTASALRAKRGPGSKIPQIGGVAIGDDVEIGANTTIDRGALDDTVIGEGVKLDNQIQIAHNVTIGAHTAIAACVGIAGSATIGRNCALGGAAMISGHVDNRRQRQRIGRHAGHEIACRSRAPTPACIRFRRTSDWLKNAAAVCVTWTSWRERVRELEAKLGKDKGRPAVNSMDIHQILDYLPHRYPFLLVDRVLTSSPARHRRDQERDDQRAFFRRPLPAPSGDARRADHRSAGADGRDPDVQDA